MYNELKNFDTGDLNIIIPNEIAAFSSPISDHLNYRKERMFNNPEKYVSLFKKLNLKSIIRFNERLYEESVFEDNGIEFHDYYFDDGTAPPMSLVLKFINHIPRLRKGLGMHCKAGLGRTGTMIALYMHEVYKVNIKAAVAWIKICRPGSITNLQFDFLVEYQMNKGNEVRRVKQIRDHSVGVVRNEFLTNVSNITNNNKTRNISCYNSFSVVSNEKGGINPISTNLNKNNQNYVRKEYRIMKEKSGRDQRPKSTNLTGFRNQNGFSNIVRSFKVQNTEIKKRPPNRLVESWREYNLINRTQIYNVYQDGKNKTTLTSNNTPKNSDRQLPRFNTSSRVYQVTPKNKAINFNEFKSATKTIERTDPRRKTRNKSQYNAFIQPKYEYQIAKQPKHHVSSFKKESETNSYHKRNPLTIDFKKLRTPEIYLKRGEKQMNVSKLHMPLTKTSFKDKKVANIFKNTDNDKKETILNNRNLTSVFRISDRKMGNFEKESIFKSFRKDSQRNPLKKKWIRNDF